jgi:archaellum component FlaC
LNLPDFGYGTFVDGDIKGIYLNNLYADSIESLNNLNESLKWHLQSYVMNYEIAILNGFSLDSGKYNNEILRTPSERIFFNWLQKVGAIKFSNTKSINAFEILNDYGVDVDEEYITLGGISELPKGGNNKSYRIGNKLYKWKGGEWRSRVLISKTVQYIGTIDMVNNVSIDYDSFNEIYLNIPSGVGGSVDIIFNNIFDENYQSGEEIDVDNDDYCIDPKFIIGRYGNESVENVNNLLAIYDNPTNHSYIIDNGYCINFNDNIYGGIEEMNLNSEDDFEFNCVLIYYKIRKAGGNWVTNLYGVLFLEEVSDLNNDGEIGGYIQRYPKFKNGNSWGLKLDLKIDAQPDSQMELRDTLYDDPNGGGVGMQMFTEALMQLNDCAKLFYDVKKENTDIEERLYKLENMVSGVDTVYDLSNDVSILRTKVEMFQPTLNSIEGRMVDIESRMTRLETNLGYLIGDIKLYKTRMLDIENNVKSVDDKVGDLKPNIEIIDGDSLTITI